MRLTLFSMAPNAGFEGAKDPAQIDLKAPRAYPNIHQTETSHVPTPPNSSPESYLYCLGETS